MQDPPNRTRPPRRLTMVPDADPRGAPTRCGHPAGTVVPASLAAVSPTAATLAPAVAHSVTPIGPEAAQRRDAVEDGSLVTEYGLLAVVAATIAGAVISWASNGALVTLFNALLRQARSLVGA